MSDERRISVVTAAPTDRKLVSVADVREQLKFKSTDTAQDTWLEKAIERRSAEAEKYCNRVFLVQTYRDTFVSSRGWFRSPLRLGAAPIQGDIASVTSDGTALDPASYTADPELGWIYRAAAPWSWHGTSLVVEYDAGFEPIPADVQQAVIDLVTMEWASRGRDPMLRAQETPQLGRNEFWVGAPPGGEMPQDIAGLLNRYRRGLIG